MQVYKIITDDTLREKKQHGTTAFPFEYYYDDIRKFDIQYIEWHWHNEFEFVSVETGPIDCLIGDERIRMQAGEGMFINSGIIHRFEAPEEGTMPNILFAPEFIAAKGTAIYEKYVAPVLSSGLGHIFLNSQTDWQRSILTIQDHIYSEAIARDSMMELNIHTQVCHLWSDFVLHLEPFLSMEKKSGNILMQSRLQIMLQYICEHYSDKITLEDIASAANVSKSETLRCFHSGVRTTPVNYLIAYRLNRAKEQLLSTKGTVTDIALGAGFDNVGYFCRIFKKTFDMTPKEFQNSQSG